MTIGRDEQRIRVGPAKLKVFETVDLIGLDDNQIKTHPFREFTLKGLYNFRGCALLLILFIDFDVHSTCT